MWRRKSHNERQAKICSNKNWITSRVVLFFVIKILNKNVYSLNAIYFSSFSDKITQAQLISGLRTGQINFNKLHNWCERFDICSSLRTIQYARRYDRLAQLCRGTNKEGRHYIELRKTPSSHDFFILRFFLFFFGKNRIALCLCTEGTHVHLFAFVVSISVWPEADIAHIQRVDGHRQAHKRVSQATNEKTRENWARH